MKYIELKDKKKKKKKMESTAKENKENSIYVRNLCVQTKTVKKKMDRIDRFDMSPGFVPVLSCRL